MPMCWIILASAYSFLIALSLPGRCHELKPNDDDRRLHNFNDNARLGLRAIAEERLDGRLRLASLFLAIVHPEGVHSPNNLRRSACKLPLLLRQQPATRRLAAAVLCSPTSLEDELLTLAAPTDRGVSADETTRNKILRVIEELEGGWTGTDAFSAKSAEMLFRRTEVAYVGQSQSVKANAAGGKYRGRVGRFLFRTDALFQHVLADVAVNVIQFRFFGLIPGAAVLQGAWKQAANDELKKLARDSKRPLSPNTVYVDFERPRVCFGREGRILNLQFGPTSSVGLDITYLSPSLRICRGAGSGIPFVFRTDTCADDGCFAKASQQWAACMSRRPLGKPALVFMLLGAAGCCVSPVLHLPRMTALPLILAAGALWRSTGGIVVSRRTPMPINRKAT